MDRFIQEIKNTADKVAKKSGELVELSKVKLHIGNTKSEISANFKKLGEMLYFSQKEDNDIEREKISEIIDKIDELYEKLAEFKEIEASLTKKKLCPQCHKLNDTDAAYCSSCGFNFDDCE